MANHAISASMDAASPIVKPGFRLVPATIGRPEAPRRVWIECPTFCTVNHAADRQIAVEDVWHSGDMTSLEVPAADGNVELLALARMGLDDYSTDPAVRAPHLFVEDAGTGEGAYLDADAAEQFADNLVAFAAKVREMARACRIPKTGVTLAKVTPLHTRGGAA
ncbi:DUF6907 domain-containing protein [Streptomyces chilikensis]|uniref:Uncharacterized protein n=1 Tax=Streptomyces chilikensis TaxID=1194079 RepID=A0ABV3EY66_9ACTN